MDKKLFKVNEIIVTTNDFFESNTIKHILGYTYAKTKDEAIKNLLYKHHKKNGYIQYNYTSNSSSKYFYDAEEEKGEKENVK